MIWILAILAFSGIASSTPINERIVGGEIAEDGQFPYQVSLRLDGRHYCAGSILNERWILTAAHCLYGAWGKLTAVVGTNTLDQGGDTYQIKVGVFHPKYNLKTFINDIGLVSVTVPIKFNDKVRPVEIFEEELNEDAIFTLSGWGLTAYPGGNTSKLLRYVNLNWINNTDCEVRINSELEYPITKQQVCTLAPEGMGACKGDSGGALVYKGKHVGIMSYGYPCALGIPDVFTLVSGYKSWIQKVQDSHQ